jgi:hypothetical protein
VCQSELWLHFRLEQVLTVFLVAKNAHRICAQNYLATKGLLAFKFEPKLLVRALLCLGNFYEMILASHHEVEP